MSGDNGQMSEGTYTYDPYGDGAPSTGVPFKYTGRRLDPETGLYYYRARYYSASLGRFLQTGPIGYKDQMNLYAYVGNDPLNATDPSGEWAWLAVGALTGGAIQTYSEIKAGNFGDDKSAWDKAKAVLRIAVSAGAGAVGVGAGVAIAGRIVSRTLGGAIGRAGANGGAGAIIGSTQSVANSIVDLKAPTRESVLSGAITGALYTAGGSLLGEAAEAMAVSAGKIFAKDAAENLVRNIARDGGLPHGVSASDLSDGVEHGGSVFGFIVGNATANVASNSRNAGPTVNIHEQQ